MILKHDSDWVSNTWHTTPEDTKYKYRYELPNGKRFFIRKFGGDLELTAEQLRKEEYELASTLLSTSTKLGYDYHVRDYYALCGGEKLVRAYLNT